MARGKKTGGRDFKPGQIGNPNGAPRVPPEVKEARKLTQNQLVLMLNKLIHMNDAEIATLLRDPATPKLEKALARILEIGDKRGDHYKIEFMLNRIIGKVQDQVKVTGASVYTIRNLEGPDCELRAEEKESE